MSSHNDKRRFSLGDIIRKINEGNKEPPHFASGKQLESDNAQTPLSDTPASPTNFSSGVNPSSRQAQMATYEAQTRTVGDHGIPRATPPQIQLHSTINDQQKPEGSTEIDIFRYLAIIMRRRWVIIPCVIIMFFSALYSYMSAQKYYVAKARLLFSPGSQEIISDNNSRIVFRGAFQQKLGTHLELLKSQAVLSRVAEKLDNVISAGAISGGLVVVQGTNAAQLTDLIDVSYRNSDMKLAQNVVNEVCLSYIEYIKEVSAQDIDRLIFKLDGQISKIQAELDQKQARFREFKEKNRMVQISSETSLLVTKAASMESALEQTNIDLLEVNKRFEAMQEQINPKDLNQIQSLLIENPYRAKIAELEMEMNNALAEYSPEHFKVQNIKRQIDQLKEAIRSDLAKNAGALTSSIQQTILEKLVALTIDRAALESKLAAQQSIVKELRAQIQNQPAIELDYATLQREVETSLSVLAMLRGKLEDAKIKRDSQESDIKVLPPLSTGRLPALSSAKVSKIYIGLLIGLVLGIALAFLLEYLDQSIKEPSDVERHLQLPLLGIVPTIEAEKAMIESSIQQGKTILEPFRALRANLKHIINLHKYKTLLVFSGVKGEGKTTLSANLAITFAMDGKKVILVDGDLRRSQMHGLFHLPKENGLSDYLLATKELVDIIKPTNHQMLFVITSGERPSNPAELIGTQRFDLLLREIRDMADIIIFDSPALLPVSDCITMAPKMDACVMIVRSLWTPLRAATQAHGQLKRIGCNIIGGILNGISHARGYYPYYYGYYRYYAYRYTYEDDESRRGFSMRELGLAVENRFKSIAKSIAYQVPHYRSIAESLFGSLKRKPLFWILLTLFLGLSTVALLFVPHSPKKHQPLIQYITHGKVPPAKSRQQRLNQGDIVDIGSVADVPMVAQRQNLPTDLLNSAAAQSGFAYKDTLDIWLKSLNIKNIKRYSAFYDSIGFSFAGGGFEQWMGRKEAEWFESTLPFQIMEAESVWAESIDPPFSKISLLLNVDDNHIKTKINQTWQQTSGGWRIVRETEQAIE